MDIDMKNMTTYLGCITLALFVVYLCTNMLSLNNKIVEGLVSKKKKNITPDEILKQLEDYRTTLSDQLRIEKYATTYKKTIVALEDIFHMIMLKNIQKADVQTGSWSGSTSDTAIKTQEGIQKAVDSLSSLDEFLTHYKPESSSSSVW